MGKGPDAAWARGLMPHGVMDQMPHGVMDQMPHGG